MRALKGFFPSPPMGERVRVRGKYSLPLRIIIGFIGSFSHNL
jgi:hypothetical protein